ncbi:hypothetical protein HK405_015963, partial [Cladochytrium tenue]
MTAQQDDIPSRRLTPSTSGEFRVSSALDSFFLRGHTNTNPGQGYTANQGRKEGEWSGIPGATTGTNGNAHAVAPHARGESASEAPAANDDMRAASSTNVNKAAGDPRRSHSWKALIGSARRQRLVKYLKPTFFEKASNPTYLRKRRITSDSEVVTSSEELSETEDELRNRRLNKRAIRQRLVELLYSSSESESEQDSIPEKEEKDDAENREETESREDIEMKDAADDHEESEGPLASPDHPTKKAKTDSTPYLPAVARPKAGPRKIPVKLALLKSDDALDSK